MRLTGWNEDSGAGAGGDPGVVEDVVDLTRQDVEHFLVLVMDVPGEAAPGGSSDSRTPIRRLPLWGPTLTVGLELRTASAARPRGG